MSYHVPELIKSHYEAGAHSSKTLECSDVNFDPYPLLNTAVQLSQWTAFMYCTERKQKRPMSRNSYNHIKCCMSLLDVYDWVNVEKCHDVRGILVRTFLAALWCLLDL